MQPDALPPEEQSAASDDTGVVEEQARPENQPDELLLEWSINGATPEHRSTTWYIILGLIAAAIIIVAIFTKTWFVIPLGIFVPWALSLYAGRGIGDHSFKLATFHVGVDDKTYPYTNFKSFFAVDTNNLTTFELVPAKRFGQLVTLHAEDDTAEDVAEILASVLPETEPQGYVGESVFKRLKF
jgi:hypothetical protein